MHLYTTRNYNINDIVCGVYYNYNGGGWLTHSLMHQPTQLVRNSDEQTKSIFYITLLVTLSLSFYTKLCHRMLMLLTDGSVDGQVSIGIIEIAEPVLLFLW